MSSFNLLSLGTQALQANQTALSTVGQNISNVNTDGYSRQRVNLVSLENQTGVAVNDIQRITDKFLTQKLWEDTATYTQTSTYSELSSQLDDLLATKTTSVSAALDDYFSALQNVVDDPVSIPNRELFIAQADSLVKRFNSLDANIKRQDETINTQIDGLASQVSTLASNIADLNDKIKLAVAANRPSNELRDQRDALTNQLSELIGIKVVDQSSDQYSIFIGNGQPLVIGQTAHEMVSVQSESDSTQKELALVIAGNVTNVNAELSGGQIGGLLQYREQALNNARDELGRIAIGFADSMNTQHQAGIDLNNKLGGELFRDINSAAVQANRISAHGDNQSAVLFARVEIQDTSQLQATDYKLVYSDNNQITLVRNSDGKQFAIDQLTPVTPAPATTAQGIAAVDQGEFYVDPAGKVLSFAMDGIKVTIETSTSLVKGDSFLIQPVRSGAEDLSLVIQDGKQLALASPIRVTANSDNQGTGVATAKVTDPNATAFATSGKLSPPVDIVFNNTSPDMTYTLYDMSEPTNPQILDLGAGPLANQTYTSGEEIKLDGFSIEIDNQPLPGDRFSFGFNLDGVSDNRNALVMSDLQKADLIDGSSYQDLYGSLVERVGTQTATSRISVEANKSVLDTTISAKAGVSGVNLDEEAAKLVQFQQAYQASAQLIRVSQTLFDSLLSSI